MMYTSIMKHAAHKKTKLKPWHKLPLLWVAIGCMVVIGGLFIMTHAATNYLSAEAEAGSLSGSAMVMNDSQASNGGAVSFGMAAPQQPVPIPLPIPKPQPIPGTLPTPPAGSPNASVPDFVTLCTISHTLYDDPIVYFNGPGKSHLHNFFGNDITAADSTNQALIASRSTTCHAKEDFSAYWVPALLNNGVFVRPTHFKVYYRAGTLNPASITAPPAGLKMVAGDAKATAAQSTSITSWSCNGGSDLAAIPANCSSNAYLTMHVYFPSCWDGVNLDSADHKSHMAYPHNSSCPADHPVPIAKLTEDIGYDITNTSGVTLASGGTITGHGDFMNGWTQSVLDALVKHCLNGRYSCGEL
jgi:hypothetical protein